MDFKSNVIATLVCSSHIDDTGQEATVDLTGAKDWFRDAKSNLNSTDTNLAPEN